MLDQVYTYKGMTATAAQLCEALGLPERVVLWRIAKGRGVNEIFAYIPNPIMFEDKVWTAAMLAEHVDLDDTLIRRRWMLGARGRNLIALPKEDEVDLGANKELAEKNREFLRQLLKHHRARGIALLKAKKVDEVEEPFDEATAMLNAQRFVEAARENLPLSTGYQWEFAA